MRVITVARKPLSEGSVAANVLEHGCGGLNIDGCRIGVDGGSQQPSGMNRFNARLADQGYRPNLYQKAVPEKPLQGGRWPSNLILVHRPGCQPIGTRKVPGNRADTRPDGDGGRSDKSQWRFCPTAGTRRGYSDQEGMETIPSWECASGCPVSALDEQSGHLLPQGAQKKQDTGDRSFLGTGFGGSRESTFYGDSGGASRFFKQIGSSIGLTCPIGSKEVIKSLEDIG